MAEQTLDPSAPRWRRPPVVDVRQVAPDDPTYGPRPRFCACGKRISQLNKGRECFACSPRVTSYSLPRGQRPAVDRG